MRRFLRIAGLAAAVLAVAAGPAAARPALAGTAAHPRLGSIGIRLMNAPVSERNNPRARVYIIDHLAPGTVIRRRVQVTNTSSAAARLSMYAAAATVGHGQFIFAAGRKQDLMTTWVYVSRRVVRLAAHSSARVIVRIRVPRNAPPGEQYGVIWAADRGRDPAHRNISLVNRVGVRIYLSVGPGNPPASNFTVAPPVTRRGAGGRPVVTVQARNTGGRAVDIGGTLTLTGGPAGLRAGPFRLTSAATLAPGQSAPVGFTLGASLPNGPWHALIKLQSGLVVRSEQSTIDFAPGGVPGGSFPIVPVAGVALLALIVVAAGMTRVRRPARQGAQRPA